MENIKDTEDKNLLVIVAVEGYANNHHISTLEALEIFEKYKITEMIRSEYEALHTQSLDETISFAEDVIGRLMNNDK